MPYILANSMCSWWLVRNGKGTVAYVSLLAEHMEKLVKHEPLMTFVKCQLYIMSGAIEGTEMKM
jgi:hypothetical protein